jgi:DNA-binding CsgD family transcriptional regulator
MERSEKDLLDLIDRLYAAAAGEQQWSAALKNAIDFFHGVGVCLCDMDWRRRQIDEWHAHGLPDMGTYAAHVNAIDPRIKFSMHRPADHIAWDALFITEREMDRHEFYDWQLRLSGARYFVGSRMRDDGDLSSMLAMNFTPQHGPPSERDIETFAIVRNHVRNAWLLRSKRDERLSRLPAFLSERLPWGVITLDLHSRILALNGQAEKIAAAKDGLRIERGQLVAWKSAENRSLQQLIGNVLRAAADPVAHKAGALLVARRSGLPGYILQVLPNIRNGLDNGGSPAVIIYISDPLLRAEPDLHVLSSAFNLSRREADLAALLLRGDSLTRAAEQLAMSRNMARNHLQAIFRKTRTNSQSSLIRLLGFLVPAAPAADQ